MCHSDPGGFGGGGGQNHKVSEVDKRGLGLVQGGWNDSLISIILLVFLTQYL